MAHIANVRKAFLFVIEINGVNQMEVQSVELPELSQEVTEHGGTNYSVGTPGMVKTGDLKLEKIRPIPGSDLWAWNWFNAGSDPFLGGGVLSSNLKRLIILRELDTSGLIVLNSYIMEGCFISSLAFSKFDRMSSENVIETLTIHVDRMRIV